MYRPTKDYYQVLENVPHPSQPGAFFPDIYQIALLDPQIQSTDRCIEN